MPVRTEGLPIQQYRQYKVSLRADFRERCGYCDANDHYCGGARGYQIDHFAPKSLFPALENSYVNLVYSCPFCNRAKWDKWVGTDSTSPITSGEGFVDPCSPDYDEHLARDSSGQVIALTPLGQYMRDNLKLWLLRHQLIWQAEKLNDMKTEIQNLLVTVRADGHHEQVVELLERHLEITIAYEEYRARVIG